MPLDRPHPDPYEDPATEPDPLGLCASCGRELGWDGLAPARDGDAWVCGECDSAIGFDALDP